MKLTTVNPLNNFKKAQRHYASHSADAFTLIEILMGAVISELFHPEMETKSLHQCLCQSQTRWPMQPVARYRPYQ